SEAAFDTEDTEDTETQRTQRTQRNIRYFSWCLSKPFLRYLGTCRSSGRTGVEGMRVSALGIKPTVEVQSRFMRRGSREARWITEMKRAQPSACCPERTK